MKYVITGSHGGWMDWYYEVNTLDEAKLHAYTELRQGEKCGVWDKASNQLLVEYEMRFDGLGVA